MYRSVDEVIADRRRGVNLAVVFNSLLATPEVWAPYGETPFAIIESLSESDYLDTTGWLGTLPIAEQIKHAKDYQWWYAQKLNLRFGDVVEPGIRMELVPPMRSILGIKLIRRSGVLEIGKKSAFIKKPLWVGKTPITNRQWIRAMGGDPFLDPEYPITNVSWVDCQAFCEKTKTRLPSKVEWEMACRAGTTSAYSFGDNPNDLNRYAWSDGNSHGAPSQVEKKIENPFLLHDMHGLVWEWTKDTNTRWPNQKYACGGSFWSLAEYCQSASRFSYPSEDRMMANVGFRVWADFTARDFNPRR